MGDRVAVGDEAMVIDAALDAASDDGTREPAPDLAWKRLGLVNVAFAGPAGDGSADEAP